MKHTIEGILWSGTVYAGVILINAILMSMSVITAAIFFWAAVICLVIQGARLIINGGRYWNWKK